VEEIMETEKGRILVESEGEGQPILLVNGLIHDFGIWNYYSKKLSRKHKVFKFDFPNQGGSYNDENCLEIEKQSQIILDVLESEKLNSQEVIVVAQSSGASAVRYLHCVKEIDFSQIYFLGINPGGLQNFYTQVYEGYLEIIDSCGVRAYYRSIAPMLFSPLFFEEYPSVLEETINSCEKTYRNRLSALKTLVKSPFYDHTLNNPPVDFRCPTHLIRGHLDYLIPLQKHQEYYSKCNKDKVVNHEFSGGHCFAFEDPVVVVEYILSTIAAN
jgi:3-oxoadipate enol-lactonase